MSSDTTTPSPSPSPSPSLSSPSPSEIECFTFHCRTFYTNSLSHPPRPIPHETQIILDTFQSILNNNNNNDTPHHHPPSPSSSSSFPSSSTTTTTFQSPTIINELTSCGLHNITTSTTTLISTYQTIMNTERHQAHSHHSQLRRQHVRNLLLTTTTIDDDHDAPPSPPFKLTTRDDNRRLRDILTTFVLKNQSDIAHHSLFAGLRRLMECQLKERKYVVRWYFDTVGVIAEGGMMTMTNDDEGGGGREMVRVLKSCLVEVRRDEEEAAGDDEGDEAGWCCWEVDKVMSDDNLKKLLHCLPRERDLDMKATGRVEVCRRDEVELLRVNANGDMDEKGSFFEEWHHQHEQFVRNTRRRMEKDTQRMREHAQRGHLDFINARQQMSRDMKRFAERTRSIFDRNGS